MPLTIWTNFPFAPGEREWLENEAAPHKIVSSRQPGVNNLTPSGPDEGCRGSDIAFGQPDPSDILTGSVRWTHLTSAGYTRYDTPETRGGLRDKGAFLTNSSGVYDDPCAQHLLAMMLAQSRQMIPCRNAQSRAEWSYGPLRPGERVLRGDKVLIVGYGAIGRRLAELLGPFRCEIRGVRRTPTGQEEVPCFPVAEVDEHLGWADHVVNILPAGASTGGFFDARRFSLFRPGALFYNVGRGDTVVQEDLLLALDHGSPLAAWLDVTSPEPLPADHPLWSHPGVFISPHIAGGLQEESLTLLRHFLENLRRFEKGEPLADQIV